MSRWTACGRIDIEPKLSVWQDYARAHRLHPAVTAYLELRPQHFYKIENDVDGVQFVTARGWEDLSAYLQAADKLALPVDEGVIGQYLRHPEVARDFAAYWVLYRKYHEDYGVEDILQGKPYDAVIARAMDASFDERISLVSLLLAGLNTRFADARATGAVTDACYQQLRSFKRTLSQQPDADLPTCLPSGATPTAPNWRPTRPPGRCCPTRPRPAPARWRC